jgi:hypothetical protein
LAGDVETPRRSREDRAAEEQRRRRDAGVVPAGPRIDPADRDADGGCDRDERDRDRQRPAAAARGPRAARAAARVAPLPAQ